MIEERALKYFIHEELFLVKSDSKVLDSEADKVDLVNNSAKETVKTSTEQLKKEHFDLVVLLKQSLTSADKAMLEKLIPAIKKSYNNTKFILPIDLDKISYNNLLAFGEFTEIEEISRLTLNIHSQVNGIKKIRTKSIEQLHADLQAKGQFWVGLKKMFELA